MVFGRPVAVGICRPASDVTIARAFSSTAMTGIIGRAAENRRTRSSGTIFVHGYMYGRMCTGGFKAAPAAPLARLPRRALPWGPAWHSRATPADALINCSHGPQAGTARSRRAIALPLSSSWPLRLDRPTGVAARWLRQARPNVRSQGSRYMTAASWSADRASVGRPRLRERDAEAGQRLGDPRSGRYLSGLTSASSRNTAITVRLLPAYQAQTTRRSR